MTSRSCNQNFICSMGKEEGEVSSDAELSEELELDVANEDKGLFKEEVMDKR